MGKWVLFTTTGRNRLAQNFWRAILYYLSNVHNLWLSNLTSRNRSCRPAPLIQQPLLYMWLFNFKSNLNETELKTEFFHWPTYISSAQQLRMASGCRVGQCRHTSFSSSQQVLLGSAAMGIRTEVEKDKRTEILKAALSVKQTGYRKKRNKQMPHLYKSAKIKNMRDIYTNRGLCC